MNSGMEDVFGVCPNRPDHPDFWRLSEVVLRLDSGFDETDAEDAEEVKERLWRDRTAAVVDVRSVTYMAFQRVMRVYGQPSSMAGIRTQAALTALWVDAFVAGAEFQRRGGHRDE